MMPIDQRPDRAAASTPRRILFVITTSDVGGAESFLEQLATRIDPERFAPVVCSLCPAGRVGERIADAGVPVESLGMAPAARLPELLGGIRRLARIIDRHSIDLVQALLYRANMMSALAARLSRRRPPVVGGQRSLTPMTGRKAALGARWTRRLTRRTVAVSEAVKRSMVAGEGVDAASIVVIGNGVDGERFRPGDRAAARRKLDLGLPAEALLVGCVGRLTDVKGFDHLLEALARGRREGAPLALAVVGDGPEREALEALSRRLELTPYVRFLGRRKDVEAIYPALDVYVLSSLREGSPNVLIEAMACGCAAVATDVGGVPEIVEPERSGLLIPPGDPQPLADALVRLAGDPELRRRLGAAARRRIEEELTIERIIARHEELYSGLLPPAPPSGGNPR